MYKIKLRTIGSIFECQKTPPKASAKSVSWRLESIFHNIDPQVLLSINDRDGESIFTQTEMTNTFFYLS